MFDLKTQNKIGIGFLIFSILFAILSVSKVFFYKYICAGDVFWHYSNEINLIRSIMDSKGIFSCFPKGLGTPLLSFYQPFFYLIVAVIHLLSFKFVSIYLIHNLMVVFLFSVYPASVFYFARSFGYSILKSGVISIFCLFAISSCGHTLDAYFSLGVHTQLIGTVVLPITLGTLHKLSFSKNQGRVFTLFTLALLFIVLGHAVYFLLLVYIVPVYLVCFTVYYGFGNLWVLLRKLFLSGAIVFVLASFWLVPFIQLNNEYRFMSPVERSGNAIYHSLSIKDFVHTFFKGELLDNTSLQSPLIAQEGRDKGLRWPDNSKYNRFYVFTIFSIMGFFLFLLTLKKFRDLFLLLLFFLGTLLFLGTDDIPALKILPFMSAFQNIRAILIIELMCAVFSGIFFNRLLLFCIDLFCVREFNFQKIKEVILKISAVLLLIFLLILIYLPLRERYFHARKLIADSSRNKVDDLQNAFFKIKQSKNNNESCRIFFNENSFYRSFADCCSIDTVIGLDTFVGSNLAWLIGDVSHRVADSSPLIDLLGIKYVVFEQGKTPKNNFTEYQRIYDGDYFDVYEVLADYPFFFIPEKKPVLVYCSKKSWYFLNKIWLKIFLKKEKSIAHMVKAPDIFSGLLDPDLLSSIILLNFPDNQKNKKLYFESFVDFIRSEGIIYSNKPLWGLPVKKLVPSDEKVMEKILLSSKPSSSSEMGYSIASSRYTHEFEYSCDTSRLVIAKTVYYNMWNALSDKPGIEMDTFCVTPGYVGVRLNKSKGVIGLTYNSLNAHTFLFLAGILFSGTVFFFRKRIKCVFQLINYSGNKFVKNHIRRLGFIITLFFVLYCSVNYFQQVYFLKTPLIYPLNNQKDLSPFEVIFHWNTFSKHAKYDFQLSEDNSFNRLSASVKNRVANFVICDGLKEKSKYYWRVKTVVADKQSRWSKIYCFYTGRY